MSEDPIVQDLRRRMDGATDALRKEFAGLRTGRASASLLDPVQVEAYGNTMPLSQVGTVSVPEPRLILVQVWDRGNVKATEKAIREAGLGLNPQTEGQTIRVPIPDLNEERRKELTRVAAKYAEQARISVRNVRRDGLDALKKQEKDHKISQDQHRKLDKDIQLLTDETIKKIDGLLAQKDKEILQVGSPWIKALPPPCRHRRRMSPSSWTAMAAGRSRAGCRASPGTAAAPTRCGARSPPPRSSASPI